MATLSNLDVGTRIDFVNSISRRTPSFSVQIIALHKHTVIAEASDPHISFSSVIQLHAFSNVQSIT